MGQPVCLAGDQDEGDRVENAKRCPHQQHGRNRLFGGDRVDDAAE